MSKQSDGSIEREEAQLANQTVADLRNENMKLEQVAQKDGPA